MANAEGMKKRVIHYIVTSLHRIHASILPLRKTPRATRFNASTLQRFNVLTRRSLFSRAFTLIELVVVLGLIIVLTGLVLSTVGYARKKSARVRAETEIAAIAAACENYKSDNGVYPRDPTQGTATDILNAKADGNPLPSPTPGNPSGATYPPTGLVLYRALSGDRNLDRAVNDTDKNFNIDGTTLSSPLSQVPQSYFTFKPNMLSPAGGTGTVTAVTDPFGNSYGYSTANQYSSSSGYNPTFDLWSTSGLTANPNSPDSITPQWIKNW